MFYEFVIIPTSYLTLLICSGENVLCCFNPFGDQAKALGSAQVTMAVFGANTSMQSATQASFTPSFGFGATPPQTQMGFGQSVPQTPSLFGATASNPSPSPSQVSENEIQDSKQ